MIKRLLFFTLLLSPLVPCPAGGPSEKASRYLEVLRRSPRPGRILDLFHAAWLETGSTEELREYLRKQGDASCLLLDALILERLNRGVEALTIYRELAGEPDPPPALWGLLARREFEIGDYGDAAAHFAKALTLANSRREREALSRDLGMAKLKLGNREEALGIWRAMLASGNDRHLVGEMVDLMLKEGLMDEALTECEAYRRRASDEGGRLDFLLREAEILDGLGDHSEALARRVGALESVGGGTWREGMVLDAMRDAFVVRDDLTGWRGCLRGLTRKYPHRLELKKRLAEVLLDIGEFEAGLKIWRRIIELSPGDRGNRVNYAKSLAAAGRLPEAVAEMEGLLATGGGEPEEWLFLAESKLKLSPSAAAAVFDRYIESAGGTEAAYAKAGGLLAGAAERDGAETVYRRMAAAWPGSFDALELLARQLCDNGKTEEADKLIARLAAVGDANHLKRVVALALELVGHRRALTLLDSRTADFADDFLFHECRHGILGLNASSERLAAAMKMIETAETAAELERAVNAVAGATPGSPRLRALADELLADKNSSVNALCLVAELRARQGGTLDAAMALERAEKLAPESLMPLETRLRIASRTGDWRKCREVLSSLIGRDAVAPPSRFRQMVDACRNDGDAAAALKWAVEWRNRCPGSVSPYLIEGRLRSASGDFGGAIELLRSAVNRFPDNGNAGMALAKTMAAAGDKDGAAAVYMSLLDGKRNGEARLAVVKELMDLNASGGLSAIEKLLLRRADGNPRDPFPPLALAELYRRRGDFENRRKCLAKVASAKGVDAAFLRRLAAMQEDDGDYARALETLRLAADMDVTGRGRAALIAYNFRHGRTAEALRGLRGAIADRADFASVLLAQAGYLIKLAREPAVMELLDAALVKRPDDGRLLYLRALCLAKAGKVDAAVPAFVTVLEDGGYPALKSGMGMVDEWRRGFVAQHGIDFPEKSLPVLMLIDYTQRERFRRADDGKAAAVELPDSRPAAEFLVLRELSRLLRQQRDSDYAGIAGRLETAGIEYADIKLLMDGDETADIQFWDKVLRERPDDRALEYLWARAVRHTRGSTAAQTRRAFELVRGYNPKYASLIVSHAVSVKKAQLPPDLLLAGFEILDTRDKLEAVYVSTLISALEGAEVPPETGRAMTAAAVRALAKMMPAPYGREYLVKRLVRVISGLGDAPDLAALIKSEIELVAAVGPSPGGGGNIFRMRRFLSDAVPRVPESLRLMFYDLSRSNSKWLFDGGADFRRRVWIELKDVKPAVLRFLVANACGEDAEAARLAAILIDAAKDEADAPLLELMATWLAERGNDIAAVKVLGRAVDLTDTPGIRCPLMGALLNHALKAADDAEAKKMAMAAAAELSEASIKREDKARLVEMMYLLGMNGMAADLAATLSEREPVNRDVKTVAVKFNMSAATRSFRCLIRPFLLGQGDCALNHELGNLIREIERKGLKESFLSGLASAGDASPLNLLEQGLASELLGEPERGLEFYRGALKMDAGALTAILRLASSLPRDRSAERKEMLKTIPRHLSSEAFRRQFAWLNAKGILRKGGLGDYAVAVDLVEISGSRGNMPLDSLMRLLEKSGGHPAWRAALAGRLCRAMMDSPVWAVDGFHWLAAAADGRRRNFSDLSVKAWGILNHRDLLRHSGGWRMPTDFPVTSFEEVLIESAVSGGRLPELAAKCAALNDPGWDGLRSVSGKLSVVAEAGAIGFSAAAYQDLIAENGDDSIRSMFFRGLAALAERRGWDDDLGEILLMELRHGPPPRRREFVDGRYGGWCQALMAAGRFAALTDFIIRSRRLADNETRRFIDESAVKLARARPHCYFPLLTACLTPVDMPDGRANSFFTKPSFARDFVRQLRSGKDWTGLPFATGVDKFQVLPLPSGGVCLYELFLDTLGGDAELRRIWHERVSSADDEPRSFGTSLTNMLLDKASDSEVMSLLIRHRGGIDAWDEPRRLAFFTALMRLRPGLLKTPDGKWIAGRVRTAVEKEYDGFMSLNADRPWEYAVAAAAVIRSLASVDDDKAVAAYTHAVENLRAKAFSDNAAHMASAYHRQLFNRIFHRHPGLVEMPFVEKLALSDHQLDDEAVASLPAMLMECVGGPGKEALDAYSAAFGGESELAFGLGWSWGGLLNAMSESERRELLTELTAVAGHSPVHTAVVEGVRLHLNQDDPAVAARLGEIMDASKLSPGLRMELYESVTADPRRLMPGLASRMAGSVPVSLMSDSFIQLLAIDLAVENETDAALKLVDECLRRLKKRGSGLAVIEGFGPLALELMVEDSRPADDLAGLIGDKVFGLGREPDAYLILVVGDRPEVFAAVLSANHGELAERLIDDTGWPPPDFAMSAAEIWRLSAWLDKLAPSIRLVAGMALTARIEAADPAAETALKKLTDEISVWLAKAPAGLSKELVNACRRFWNRRPDGR